MMKTSRYFWYLLLLLGFVASTILSFTNSIQMSESYAIWLSTKSVQNIVLTEVQSLNFPLYPVLLHFWIQIFGTDIILLRLLSILLLACTLYYLYFAALESTRDMEIALFAIVMFALSPFIVWYTTGAQAYALFSLVVCANHLFFLRLERTNGKEGKMGFLLSTLLGVFTHYLFVFLIFSQLIYIIARSIWDKTYEQKTNTMHNYYYLVITLIGLVLGVWFYYISSFHIPFPHQTIPSQEKSFIGRLFINLFFGFTALGWQGVIVAIWPISVVFLFLVFTRGTSNLNSTLYLIIVTFLPIVLAVTTSFLQPLFVTRYLIFVAPTLFILSSWLLVNFSNKVFPLVLLFVACFMGGLTIYQIVSPSYPVKENYKSVVAFVNEQVTPYDIVVVASPFALYPVTYYYNGYARIDTIPPWKPYSAQPIPVFSESIMKKQIATYKNKYGRIFVILSYDQGYNTQISYYLDHNFQRLAFKIYPPNIEVRVYRMSYIFSVPSIK